MAGGIVSRVFLVAIIGGVLAGLFLTAVQRIQVVPLILEAEAYETASEGSAEADGHAHDHGGEGGWAPEDGAERTAYTALANILAGVGLGLLLSAAYALRGGVDWKRGLLWGFVGFVTFNLAPALGLPPELPGAAAAALGDRQIWWLFTVVFTGGGIAVFAFSSQRYLKPLGLVLIALPHIVGAPQPESHQGLAPAELERSFIYASLLANAAFWIVLGGLSGFLFEWLARGAGGESPAPGR